MSYNIPNRVPLPTPRPQQNAGMMGAFPPAPAAPAPAMMQAQAQPAQGGGIRNWLGNNSEALAAMSQGLLSGRTGSEQFAQGFGGFVGARAAGKKRTKTMEFLEQQDPLTAQAVGLGLIDGPTAFKAIYDARNKPTEYQQRAQAAQQYGIDPNTPEGRAFVLTGKLPDNEGVKPLSTVGKINADFNAGLIDKATRDAQIRKLSTGDGFEITTADGTVIRQGPLSNQDVKNTANRISDQQDLAASGAALKQTVQVLRKANKRTGYSGVGGGLIGGVLDAGEQLGLDLPGDPGSRAIMRSGGLDVALQQVQKTKGAISNAEMALFMAAAPGMQTTEPGNEALFGMIDAIADRQIMRANEMENWRRQNGSLEGFEAAWGDYINNNPIITPDMFPQQGQPAPAPSGDVQSYRDYFGGN